MLGVGAKNTPNEANQRIHWKWFEQHRCRAKFIQPMLCRAQRRQNDDWRYHGAIHRT
jgi:hypothetical protein